MSSDQFFDVKAWLDARGVSYDEEGKNISYGWIGMECPFCNDPSTHFGVNVEDKFFSCWVCGVQGRMPKLVQKIDGVNYAKVYDTIEEFSTAPIRRKKVARRRKTENILPPEAEVILRGREPLLVRRYFEKRSFPLSLCQERGLLFSEFGEYMLSLIIPVELDHEVVTFQSLDLTGLRDVKYRSCPAEKSARSVKESVYNIDVAKGQKQIIVMEGVTDVWRVGDCGVGIFGKVVTEAQLLILLEVVGPDKMIKVLLDADAKKESWRTYEKLHAIFDTVKLVHLGAGDPGNLTQREVQGLLEL